MSNNIETINIKGRIRTYKQNLPNDIEWNKVCIKTDGKYFQVLLATKNLDGINKTFIRPIKEETNKCSYCSNRHNTQKGYHLYEYENLFDFQNHCSDFDELRTIDISDAI